MSDLTPSPEIGTTVSRIARPAFAKDSGLRFVAVNDAFLERFGVDREAILGRSAADVFGGADSREEKLVLVFGAPRKTTILFDGSDYVFGMTREGSLAETPFLVGTLESVLEATDTPEIAAPVTPTDTSDTDSTDDTDDLANIAQHMKSGVLLVDRTLVILAVNDIFYNAWNIDRESVVVGDSFADFLNAGRGKRLNPMEDAAWAEHVKGVERAIICGEVPVRDIELDDGKTILASGVALSGGRRILTFEDVSLRDHSVESIAALERMARSSERLLRGVIDNIPATMIVYDRDNNFVLDNKARRETFPLLDGVMRAGSTLADFVDLIHTQRLLLETESPELDAIHDTDPETWKKRRIAEHDAPAGSVERRVSSDLWLKVTDRRLEDGTLVRLWTDISEIRKREVALDKVNTVAQTSLKTLRAAIEAMPGGMGIWDRHEQLIIWNEQFTRQFPGVDLYPGKPVREILHELAHTGIIPDIKGREEKWGLEKFLEWREGIDNEHVFETHDGRWLKRVDRKAAGGLRVGLRLDVTELKHREIELEGAKVLAEAAERSKSEFLANMSHEIRTPMNGILGMAEILSKTELNDRQRNFADIIVSSGNALLTIINDILDFSKIDAGQLALHPEPFSLAQAIDDVATLLSTRATEKGIEMIVRVAPDMPDCLIGDAGRLRQVVTNLLGNALKFTHEGHVLVDIEAGSGEPGTDGGEAVMMRCRVVDTGIGIPEDRVGDVFDSFSQVDGSSTRRFEGTGLGLAIATRLVGLMGGRIGCESVVDEGSTFWFEVPFDVEDATRRPEAPPEDMTGRPVLIIDDNAVNRSILLEQLHAWGFEGEAVESGEAALSTLRARHVAGGAFDAVILDYHMPGMNGLQVARVMRRDGALAGIPIVMLTSIDLDADAPSFRALRVEGYLVKPARSALLLRALTGAMRRPADASPTGTLGSGIIEGVAEPDDPEADAPAPHIDVLIADDNAVNQLIMREVLSALGLSSVIAEDGVEAVEAYRTHRPRLVLMDVTMPRMDGHDATRAIREMEGQGARVPIVGATAHAAERDRFACLDSGMDDYISKPIGHKDLERLVLRWLGEERSASVA